MAIDIDARLSEMQLVLPEAPKPIAVYVPAVRTGDLLVISGQLPLRDGELIHAGRVPAPVSVEQARAAARQCTLNGLAIVKDEIYGQWARLRRIVRLGVFVQSDHDFHDQAKVANGASELLGELLGEDGRHARAAVGVSALPINACVELEMMVELAE